MPSTKEIHFEESIEQHLLETTYIKLDAKGYDAELGVWPSEIIAWVKESQPKTWDYLSAQYGGNAEADFVQALVKQAKNEKNGMLALLRKGFDVYGKNVKLAQYKPNTGLNPETKKLYDLNRLAVSRQVHQSPVHKDQSVDMVVALNGIPIASLELKNEQTGQSVTHAINQYKRRRHQDPLFAFKTGALVHFAVDTSEVHYCTRLLGEKSFFLPFNKGDDEGAGNPVNPRGHKTAYLWEYILQKDSLLDIVRRFLHVQRDDSKDAKGKKVIKEAMIFPRYHQLDAVRELTLDAARQGPGQNYLIQHSAGSGKSNTIAWLAHRLSTLHNYANERVFDQIIVLTDRKILDKQLQNTIYQMDHEKGVVQKIDEKSSQLESALKGGTQIVISTIQKFPYVSNLIGSLPDRRYALIVDEAHSSQSGEMSKRVKEILKDSAPEDEEELLEMAEWEQEAYAQAKARGKQSNISMFAFTATPKNKTLQVFGHKDAQGDPKAFHLYTMKQAIQEGFILDVLQNYTTYKSYFGLEKKVLDDPDLSKSAAKKAIARYLDIHPTNVAQKVEIIIRHFQQHVQHKINGKARAMVVTSSRNAARLYRQAFDAYIAENHVPWKTLVAFTGKLVDKDTGEEFTEASMNGFPDSKTAAKFNEHEYRIMIVADKFQTGFDQPLLYAMYVDKKLRSVAAVQTLSRLNRTHPEKDGTFVLDFANTHEEILEAFQPYYRDARIEDVSDPQDLYRLRSQLLDAMVFDEDDVKEFCEVFFAGDEPSKDHPALVAVIQRVLPHFKDLEVEDQDAFSKDIKTFGNMYQFVAHIANFADLRLEQLFVFTRALRSYLPKGKGVKYDLSDDVDLEYFRLEQKQKGAIQLSDESAPVTKGPGEGGVQKEDKKDKLSAIVKEVNAVLGTDFTEADKVFFEQILTETLEDPQMSVTAQNNSMDHFQIVFEKAFDQFIMERMMKNEEIAKMIFDNKDARTAVVGPMGREAYRQLKNS